MKGYYSIDELVDLMGTEWSDEWTYSTIYNCLFPPFLFDNKVVPEAIKGIDGELIVEGDGGETFVHEKLAAIFNRAYQHVAECLYAGINTDLPKEVKYVIEQLESGDEEHQDILEHTKEDDEDEWEEQAACK